MDEHHRKGEEFSTRVWSHWDLVNRLASRRFDREAEAEEAALYVLERLAEDDWQKLRKFQGRSSFAGYLATVAGRLLEDFSRRRYGRKRPPGWLERRGGWWRLLYRLLCLERFSFAEAVEMTADRYHAREAREIEEAASMILGRISDCGAHQYQETEYREEFRARREHCRQVEQDQSREIVEALGIELFGTEAGQRRYQALKKMLDQPLELSAEDRLLLRLRHQENLGTAAAGRMLGLNRFQAHGRLRRLYGRIREAFSKAGCEQELALLFRD